MKKGKPNINNMRSHKSLSTAPSQKKNKQLSVDLAVEEMCIREKILKVSKKLAKNFPAVIYKNSTYIKQSFLH